VCGAPDTAIKEIKTKHYENSTCTPCILCGLLCTMAGESAGDITAEVFESSSWG